MKGGRSVGNKVADGSHLLKHKTEGEGHEGHQPQNGGHNGGRTKHHQKNGAALARSGNVNADIAWAVAGGVEVATAALNSLVPAEERQRRRGCGAKD